MGAQFTLPNKLRSKQTMDHVILVYSLDSLLFSGYYIQGYLSRNGRGIPRHQLLSTSSLWVEPVPTNPLQNINNFPCTKQTTVSPQQTKTNDLWHGSLTFYQLIHVGGWTIYCARDYVNIMCCNYTYICVYITS